MAPPPDNRTNDSTTNAVAPPPPGAADDQLQSILRSARPFLRGELESVDENLPRLVAVLRSVGAGECWHKHGSFLDHLLDIYRILKLWGAPEAVCLCGLFHSAYSNSYVNLAIFDPSTARDVVRAHVGDAAEDLIHLFCVVPRQSLIHDDLLFRYPDDAELRRHLSDSEATVRKAKEEKGELDAGEAWRVKLNSILPREGVKVRHIKTGEEILVSRRVVAVFLLMTMADFSDQLFGFQDALFENSDGRLEFAGNNFGALWPGDGKPGLWINSISRMGAVYSLIAREEEIVERELGIRVDAAEMEMELELVVPPVLKGCTEIVDATEQMEARELYWEAVAGIGSRSELDLEAAEELLVRSVEKNAVVGEPRVVLAQVYLSKGRFEEAEREAAVGLRLILEWGSAWDKRMSWEGWVSWARVLLMKAEEKSWPNTSWGILNLGLVR
ncbi:unnamed protein product [Linum tenue]|uniref:DUF6817 domain-containing protein n=2 Tax=Linum tenue TaxID=586396 RepID=A0AAV0MCY7_9ROSI|nr:unnamed protein product [Linum tenue]